MDSLFPLSDTTVCTAVLVGLAAVSSGCSAASRESGDVADSTGGSAGQSMGAGHGGREASEGSGGAGIGGSGPGGGGVTAVGGATIAGGPGALGGAPGVGGADGIGGDPSIGGAPGVGGVDAVGGAPSAGGAPGSGGTRETGGAAGVGENPSGGASSGVGGEAGNAGDRGGGGDSALGGQAGTTASGGSSTGGSDSGCDPAPGPCSETTSYSTSAVTSTITYFYDGFQKLIRTETDDEPPFIIRYAYDEAGRLVESINDGCDRSGATTGTCRWILYTYDDQGNLVLEESRSDLDPYTESPYCDEYTYDENGVRLTSMRYETCSGSPTSYYAYEYDAAGQLVTSTLTNPQGDIVLIRHFTRNAAGQPLVVLSEWPNDEDQQQIFTYDDQGNEISRRQVWMEGESVGEEFGCFVSTYDDCGNMLTEDLSIACDDRYTRLTYTYECFDE